MSIGHFCYLEDGLHLGHGDKAWSDILSSFEVSYLKNKAWVRKFFHFQRVLFFSFPVPEPLVKLLFRKTRLGD